MSKLLKSKFFLGALIVAGLAIATSANAAYTHTVTLKMGSKGAQVMALQQTLNMTSCKVSVTGVGSAGMESTTFGTKTLAAVKCFQAANGLTADGVVGPMTGAKLVVVSNGSVSGNFPAGCTSAAGYSTTTGQPCNAAPSLPAGCTSTAGYSPTTGAKCDSTGNSGSTTLTGTVGSLDYALTAGYGSKKVGEAEKDVKVAGLELDATNSDSDVAINAVKLNFNRGTAAAATDLEDVATKVSIWLGSTKVGEADASAFNDDNDEEKTVSLSGAVVKKGEKANLYVALSGVNNLDSGDVGDSWTVDYTQIRFIDAQGVTVTEDPGTGTRSFTFETFATANSVELKASLTSGQGAINEAHVINVDATDTTDNVPLLAFSLKANGDSDVTVKEIPVLATVTGAANVDDMVTSLDLYQGSTLVDSQSVPATAGATETITFDGLDIKIDAGTTEKFTVKANFLSLADALDAGDTIKLEMTGTEVDAIVAEDESGEDVGTGDLTGTALGEASEARDIGMMVSLVGTPTAVVSHVGDPAGTNDHDQGTFTITFDVTAFDGDVYIDHTAPDASGGATESDLDSTGSGSLVATITSPSGATDGAQGFLVEEGTTERFTITVNVTPGADEFTSISLTDILYALTDVDGDIQYTFNLEDFKTPSIFLNFDAA